MILEVCVETPAGLAAAVAGGADRLELCAALALGGLTPSVGMMRAAAGCGVPVMAMIRPRAGDFVWSEAEIAVMEADIAAAYAAGLAGVVLGASLPDGTLDLPVLRRLVAAATAAAHRSSRFRRDGAPDGTGPEVSRPLAQPDLTLHRCFDLVPDMAAALEAAVELGVRRILTSGGAVTAVQGAARIGALVGQAAGRVSIMVGAGITAAAVPVLRGLGVREVHGSCSAGVPIEGPAVELGFTQAVARQTDGAQVRAVKRAMEEERQWTSP